MSTTQSFSIWEGDAIQLEICNLCQKTFEHSADEFQKFCDGPGKEEPALTRVKQIRAILAPRSAEARPSKCGGASGSRD